MDDNLEKTKRLQFENDRRTKFWMDVFVAQSKLDRSAYALREANTALDFFDEKMKKGELK